MENFLRRYAGVLIGAVYALLLRLVFNIHQLGELFSLFSITFIWVTPVIIGLIPLFYASKEQLKSWKYRVSSPVLTVIIFFILCFLTRIEDLICLWVILIPYAVGAMIAGLIAGEIITWVKNKKGTVVSIVLIPLIISPVEQQFKTPTNTFSVATKVIINATPETIWENIVRVREIEEKEFAKGFFNYAGIPRPLFAELDKDSLGATRTGHFEGGLKFIEKVTDWNRNKYIAFNISVVPSTIRQTVFDQHILRGNHFKFLDAAYSLTALPNGQTELTLRSSYQLTTNINWYASFCGDQLLSDFQERLLSVIKARCDKH